MGREESEYIPGSYVEQQRPAAAGYPVDVKAEWIDELGAVTWVD